MHAAPAEALLRCASLIVAAGVALFAVWPARGVERLPSLEALSATRDKPLFSPTRQKPPEITAAVAMREPEDKPVAESTPQYELAGIIAGADEVMVLLRDPKRDELIKIRSGDRIGDWEVLAMSNYSVRLQNGQRKIDIQIFSQ
jgi:hypothetical protein